ncbi:O-methyltransferase, putative, partial [Paecilomyces variotii No. 5]
MSTVVTPGSSAQDWSATQYLKFAAQRNRPVKDLVAQIPLSSPRKIVDLGCGPGNSTQALIERYPSAQIRGLDNSPDMLSKARANVPNVDFSLADLSTWTPDPEDE